MTALGNLSKGIVFISTSTQCQLEVFPVKSSKSLSFKENFDVPGEY